MNKRIIKYFWALPLLGMLSSCSDSSVTENSQNASNAINFSVTTSKQSSSDGTVSRATIVDNSVVNAENSSFGLYAYTGDWTQGTAPSTTPDFMNNQEVNYKNGSWQYDPLKFWSDAKVSFFAYWPYTTGVTKASAVANAMPQVEFTQKMDAENMVDFIASHAINQDKNVGVVGLDFKHVLTRLNFKARLDQELIGNKSTHIFIKEMKICGTDGSTTATGGTKANTDSRFFSTATFVLGDGLGTQDPTAQGSVKYLNDAEGQWKYDAEQTPSVINKATPQKEALDVTSLMPIATTTLTSDGTTKDMTGAELKQNGDTIGLFKPTADKKQHYLFLIPPYGIEGIKNNTDVIVELKYDVVTADPSLEAKFTPVDSRVAAVSLPTGTLQQGKAYNIVFTVGLNPVKVEANVTDWDTDLIENAPEEKAANNDKASILDAWKKLNDTKKQDETANYFVIKVNKPADKLDLRTDVDAEKDLAAFQLGDQVELLFNDEDGGSYNIANNVLVPNGWYCEDREVNHVKRHIITKVTNYITKVAENGADAIAAALTELNKAKGEDTKGIRYYAVNVYSGTAPSVLDLTSTGTTTPPVLDKFEDGDYIYIYFNSDGGGDKNYKAPANWEIVKVETTPLGKYRLQKKTSSQTSNVAIGNTGFVAGSTINVNK